MCSDIVIRPLTPANRTDFNRCDDSFVVDAELCLVAEDSRISYTTRPVAPYTKRYEPEADEADAHIGQTDRAAWLAYVEDQVAGQILVKENWNRLAVIPYVAVDPTFRRRGIGRTLIDHAIGWARERGLPGLVVETQSINVAACRLYETCGFSLDGFDSHLYRGIERDTREVALFWYLIF